ADVPIISDELYEATVFGGVEHFSTGSIPQMAGRVITINGFSKTYRMTGFRVGYMVGPARFVRSAQKIKQTLTICAPSISQYAAAGDGYVRISLLAPTPRLLEGLDRVERYLATQWPSRGSTA